MSRPRVRNQTLHRHAVKCRVSPFLPPPYLRSPRALPRLQHQVIVSNPPILTSFVPKTETIIKESKHGQKIYKSQIRISGKTQLIRKISQITDPKHQIPELERLDRTLTRASLFAEKNLPHQHQYDWSTAITNLRNKLHLLRLYQKQFTTNIQQQTQIQELITSSGNTSVSPPKTLSKCIKQIRQTKSTLWKNLKEHRGRRKEELQSKILSLENQTTCANKQAKTAIRNIIRAEATKQLYQKLKSKLKPTQDLSITQLQIPTNPSDNPTTCTNWNSWTSPQTFSKLSNNVTDNIFTKPTARPLPSNLFSPICHIMVSKDRKHQTFSKDRTHTTLRVHHLQLLSSKDYPPYTTRPSHHHPFRRPFQNKNTNRK